jgi:GrpB-like predicted nucleotidyltransferase (UPF0157 family)
VRGPIEHIGSTAIPGLVAKPTIDMMAGVATLEASRPGIEAAAQVGYCYAPYRVETEHWFCKPSPAVRPTICISFLWARRRGCGRLLFATICAP